MKILLLLAWVLFFVTGCQKDEVIPKSTTELLQGSWKVASHTYDGYDASNLKVYTNTTQNTSIYIISGQNISISDGTTTDPWATYTLSEQQNKKYIHVAGFGLNATFELAQLTPNNMTWQRETQNDTYQTTTGVRKDAKSIITIQFQK
ncbi:hypothetical protein [Adhaeribacter radiodurans]|uniref:Lipocalin family protein n=1 Tax=Adhaeribacter radiodurans TaxID=2745197 RepID=A0A7L7L6R5_9BACT|nr:hypothetical protein [Adhaeribacter radiodurans]QMU28215.1 hypothetical protein HUW48_09255 [Adhaeribacter radiodurans]